MNDTKNSFAPTRDERLDAIAASPGVDTARFATFNVLHGCRPGGSVDIAAFASAVAGLGADVVGLQEVDVRSFRSRRVDMAARAARAMRAEWSFGAALRRWDLGRYGNALLSRTSLRDCRVLQLPKFSARTERRVGVIGCTDAGGSTWSVATAHLSLDRDEAKAQLHVLLQELATLPAPRVLMGDLNLRPEAVHPIAEEAGWNVAETGPTYPSWDPAIRIDYCITQGAIVDRVAVVSLAVSDHAALVTDLQPVHH